MLFRSGTTAGVLLGGLTLLQVIAAIGLSAVVDRFTDRRPILLLILATIALGLLTLLIAQIIGSRRNTSSGSGYWGTFSNVAGGYIRSHATTFTSGGFDGIRSGRRLYYRQRHALFGWYIAQ